MALVEKACKLAVGISVLGFLREGCAGSLEVGGRMAVGAGVSVDEAMNRRRQEEVGNRPAARSMSMTRSFRSGVGLYPRRTRRSKSAEGHSSAAVTTKWWTVA